MVRRILNIIKPRRDHSAMIARRAMRLHNRDRAAAARYETIHNILMRGPQ